MIGENDRYRPDEDKKGLLIGKEYDYARGPREKRTSPAIGSSSIPFEGDIEVLLEFCDQVPSRWRDESWDGCHVAENAKSDGEAEVHGTNGHVRLVVATETTKNDCVAVLMDPLDFAEIYRSLRWHRKCLSASQKIGEKQGDVGLQLSKLKIEIRELEEYLLKLQASGPAEVGTLRCQERLTELRVRLKDTEHRKSKLQRTRKRESEMMQSVSDGLFEDVHRVFIAANLFPELEDEPFHWTDDEPSPSLERPISYMHEELPLPSTADSSTTIFEADIEDNTQFPSLSTPALHGPDETSSVDAEASQSAEQQKRDSTVSPDVKDKKSASDPAEEKEGNNDNLTYSRITKSDPNSYDTYRGPPRNRVYVANAHRQSYLMHDLALRRRDNPDGNRDKLYRQQHDRRVQAGKVPETREAFDARWKRDHDRFVRNTTERLRQDRAMKQVSDDHDQPVRNTANLDFAMKEEELRLRSPALASATPEILLTTPKAVRADREDGKEDYEEYF